MSPDLLVVCASDFHVRRLGDDRVQQWMCIRVVEICIFPKEQNSREEEGSGVRGFPGSLYPIHVYNPDVHVYNPLLPVAAIPQWCSAPSSATTESSSSSLEGGEDGGDDEDNIAYSTVVVSTWTYMTGDSVLAKRVYVYSFHPVSNPPLKTKHLLRPKYFLTHEIRTPQ